MNFKIVQSLNPLSDFVAESGMGCIMFWQLGGDGPEDGLVDAIYGAKMGK